MILVVDAGNTRIKWGLWEDGAWQGKGSLASEAIEGVEVCFGKLQPDWVGVACVAGDAVGAVLDAALAGFTCPIFRVQAVAEAFAVRCGYRDPVSLGADRWANLVACQALGLTPCVVASLGTAMTVDAIDASGAHLGGLILPGTDLMRHGLREGTAGIRAVEGDFEPFPGSTGNAVETGILEAQAGALAGLRARFEAHAGRAVTAVLTGGDSARLLGRVPAPVRVVDDLVMEGVLWMAKDLGVRGI